MDREIDRLIKGLLGSDPFNCGSQGVRVLLGEQEDVFIESRKGGLAEPVTPESTEERGELDDPVGRGRWTSPWLSLRPVAEEPEGHGSTDRGRVGDGHDS